MTRSGQSNENAAARLQEFMQLARDLRAGGTSDERLATMLDHALAMFPQADVAVMRSRWGTRVTRSRASAEHSIEDIVDSKLLDVVFDGGKAVAAETFVCAAIEDGEQPASEAIYLAAAQGNAFCGEDLELLRSIAALASFLVEHDRLRVEARQGKQDLELLKLVREEFVPKQRPEVPGYEFCDVHTTALVYGDHYDYFTFPDGRVAILVADAVGFSPHVAMVAAHLSGAFRCSLAISDGPADAMAHANDWLVASETDRFVTLALAVLDPLKHEVTICNAGHMPPILRHADGQIEVIDGDTMGLPLGIIEGMEYKELTIPLRAGEMLLLATDGLNEALDADFKQYGLERLRRFVSECSGGLQVICESLIDDVRRFVGQAPASDDMTLIGLAHQADVPSGS